MLPYPPPPHPFTEFRGRARPPRSGPQSRATPPSRSGCAPRRRPMDREGRGAGLATAKPPPSPLPACPPPPYPPNPTQPTPSTCCTGRRRPPPAAHAPTTTHARTSIPSPHRTSAPRPLPDPVPRRRCCGRTARAARARDRASSLWPSRAARRRATPPERLGCASRANLATAYQPVGPSRGGHAAGQSASRWLMLAAPCGTETDRSVAPLRIPGISSQPARTDRVHHLDQPGGPHRDAEGALGGAAWHC